jgi:transposase
MIKTFKYRLIPTRQQTAALEQTLYLCRRLYNCALEQRRMHRTTQFAQMRELTEVRAEFAEYRTAHVHALQNTLKKLNRAFEGFFRRSKGDFGGHSGEWLVARRVRIGGGKRSNYSARFTNTQRTVDSISSIRNLRS